jgi:hypothetical protein
MALMSQFGSWVQAQVDLRGYSSVKEAAHALDIYPSVLRQWLSIVRRPSHSVVRRAATAFDVHIQEVLVAADYMTEEESGLVDAVPASVRHFTIGQMLEEIGRRTEGR